MTSQTIYSIPQRQARRAALAVATTLAGGLLAQHPAYAQDAAQLSSIQAQIGRLQAQLKTLQRQAAARDQNLRQAQTDAAQARVDAAQAMSRTATYAAAIRGLPLSTPPGYTPQGPAPVGGFAMGNPNPNATSLQGSSPASITTTSVDKNNPSFQLGGLTVTLGGFLDTSFIYRSRNLTSGSSTSFGAIPFNNSASGHVSEFRESSQNSRFSILLKQADTKAPIQVAGYLEGDFQGAATTSNSVQSSSYTPRMRLAYATLDDHDDGWHLLAGQNWSLAVGSTVGITPRKESLPPVIDNNYLPGFVYTRSPQVRVVKDFGGKVWLGASLEAPQETYSSAGIPSSGSLLSDGKTTITYNNPGGSFLNSTTNYSFDTAPDMVVKAAFDLGFGHFEAYGLGRFFRTRTALATGVGETHTVFGGGVGGSTVIPLIPKYLDLVGNVLAGDGVGRYGTSQLSDATFDSQGRPVPLPQIIGMAGLVGHPNKAVDIYGFVGEEQNRRSTYEVTTKGKTTGYGYGTPFANTAGCEVEDSASSLCSAQTREVQDLSVGGWWRFLHGGYGTVQVGAEYSYVKRIAYSGTSGRPDSNDNIMFVTLRFLPFQ